MERRQLLTQFTFNVPQNDGYTSVYLLAGQEDGWVEVFKNSPTGTPVWEFRGDSNLGTGMYIVDAGGIANFVFVDRVPAERKPTGSFGTPSDNGILVKASSVSSGNEGHLKVEGTANDKLFRITESTSTSATVEVTDNLFDPNVAHSRFGAGVNQLTIQTHTNGFAVVRVATEEFGGNPDLPGLHPNTSLGTRAWV